LAYLLDTSIAIYLREGLPDIVSRVVALPQKPFLSVVSRVELEGGVYAKAEEQEERRIAVDAMLRLLPVLDFDYEMSEVYGQIVAQSGFSRRKIIDRMIAATALVGSMTVITTNGDDFADIDGLKLEIWQV
jgi:predicted nucleic acid-binding protein